MVRLERGGVVVTIADDAHGRKYIAVGMPRKRPQGGERILALQLGGPFGGGWRYVLGVKVGRRTIVLELLVVSIRVAW